MTYEQAVEKANANNGSTGMIMEWRETALRLVGKTLVPIHPPYNTRFEVIEIVNSNYIMKINGNDYNISPVPWTIKMLGAKIKVEE